MAVFRLDQNPLHLGLGAKAVVLPEFTGDMVWYDAYGIAHDHDGKEGRLVSIHSFTESWDSWEMHPLGDEVVLCLSGEMTLLQEMCDGATANVIIKAGEYAINPPGCWHTADVAEAATALFITAGLGTEHRAR
jgi:mannose-6-phosphate isomerase-like protein (cupin superfamily)